jgi:hypothetical protein
VVVYLYYGVEVAALKIALESQLGLGLDCGVHAFEDAVVLRFEIRVKFAEISGHVLVVSSQRALVLEGVVPLQLLMHLEAALEPVTYF